ncbi:hypothetical protein LAZ67_15002803 [Cordylochernes scorpioides]|uniref:Mos1 transposase HTH domain-containing protein n=1 Tax=Cordylochernes scorpioides TaxID=51811 RepID=A0ABY6LEM4_9ARAC|nr:hypothetical protein LAZ67_15002803 [Cordylochernes scorpioides]
MLTVAYGEATVNRSNVYRWYKMFSEGREDVNDEERAGRPSTSTTDEKINEVEKMILANRRITVREVAEDLNISIGSCHSIFINDLGMRRVAAKFVPKLLNCDQKQHRMNIANEMLDSVRDDPNLLQRVITGDESWVYGYDVETKAQSSQWKLPHEPRPKKARQIRYGPYNVNIRIRQRSVTEFIFKSGDISATTIHSKLQPVYGNETLDRSTIQRWVQRFRKGDFDLHDKERQGKPSTVTTDQNLALVKEIIKNNRTITAYHLMKNLSISKGSVLKLLSGFGYRKTCSKWVPKLLTREMIQTRKELV